MEELHELEGTTSGEEEEGEEGEEVTPAELVSRLREAWLNEKLCPDLLPQHSELTECVVEQLTHMEGNLRRVQRADVKSSLHRMELERIRFMLSSYLRTRLNKIERFYTHVLEREKSRTEGQPSLLSPEEFAFAIEYASNMDRFLKSVALRHMPPNLQALDLSKAVPRPDVGAFVFLRVRERQENVLVEAESSEQREFVVDLEEGSQHLMRYSTVAPLLLSSSIHLI
ncbi:DNA replication complex GINS protein SLD5 isoform X1 [Lampetra fluviatilis]